MLVRPTRSLHSGGRKGGSGFAAPDILSTSFENGGWDSGFLESGNTGDQTIVADATANGGHSLQLNWRSGAEMTAGAEATFSGHLVKTCYWRMRFKQPSGFDNSGIKKICRFQGAGFNGLYGTLINNHGVYNWTWDGDSLDFNVASPTPDSLQGAWHYIEVMNDISTSPYTVKIWFDGVLSLTAQTNFSYGNVTIGAAEFMGIFNTPAFAGTEWIDELALSTQRIGP